MANIQKQYDLFIDGKFVPASDGKTFEAHNPANGEVLASFAEATREDVDLAVKAAHRALKSWRKTSPIERQNYLLKIADIIDQNAEHLALVETLDNGKPPVQTFKSGRQEPLDFGKGGVMIINAQSCKGLEFDIVILADIDQHKPKENTYPKL